ncbi:unnamed protein product [Adineta ricciae]|uniref:Uncharacterized protein n=1 Tax=Adineta ricciae TaxID=249248 RepID=A0A813RD74_ADIRI|nr:unnamed protein product [Adineta ricciae]
MQSITGQTGGEIAIWLLITVGALLIPIIAIAICCIRRHCWQNIPARRPTSSFAIITNADELLTNSNSVPWNSLVRGPQVSLMANHTLRMMMNTKRAEALRSYNGPYVESGHEDGDTTSRTSSLKKQHVHWTVGSETNQPSSIKKHPWSDDNILTTTTLAESPSSHRRSSAFKHLIQTAIVPAGSTVPSTDASQFLTLSKEIASIPTGNDYIV